MKPSSTSRRSRAIPHRSCGGLKRLIALRKQLQGIRAARSIEFLRPNNPKVFAFVRRHEDERVLVVANLSRFVQYAELDGRAYSGLTPLELFGRSQFPAMGEQPYPLVLGPHSFYWFSLEAQPAQTSGQPVAAPEGDDVPHVSADIGWLDLVFEPGRETLESLLPGYLRRRQLYDENRRASWRARALLEVA